MTKQGKKEEIIAYGEDATALLQYIVDGTKTKADAMVKYSIDFSRLKKLKLSIKKEFGRPYVKCNVRYEGDEKILTEPGDVGPIATEMPEFKTLEKSFKAIGDRLKNGGLPSNLEMASFCRNAEVMTAFPGHGDAQYPAFLQLIAEFRDSFHQYDLESCRKKHAQIKSKKNSCHHERR
ncbi:MAG: GAK system XXXCH domain-containing protein [Deltaproteobacteria bacterium]|nr:GAK system XXXCH domain-containing protein [Deltaproteobacteria bacterium]